MSVVTYGDFKKLCRIAMTVTLLFAVTETVLNIVLMLLHLEVIKAKTSESFFGYFYRFYIIDDWIICTKTAVPRKATSANAVFIWIVVLLVLDILWMISAIVMETKLMNSVANTKNAKDNRPLFEPWCLMTIFVLLFDLAAFIVFIIDVGYANSIESCIEEEKKNNVLMATLVLPVYFLKGFAVWILLLILVIMVIFKGGKVQTESTAPTTCTTSRNLIGRSLSDYPDSYHNDNLDRDYPSELRAVDLPLNRADERRVSDAHWVFANESFEPDSPRIHMAHSEGQGLYENRQPLAYQPPRRISEFSQQSELSEPRRIGHPTPLNNAKSDFSIPRAKADLNPRRPIRTPSGRSVRAADYLKDFSPKESPLPEERVEREYVRLKN